MKIIFIIVYRIPHKTAQYRDIFYEKVLKEINLIDRGKKKANFHVLRESRMPALLTENGFIDSNQNAEKLSDPEWREAVARGHVDGLVKAFNSKKNAESHNHRVIVDGVQVGAYKKDQNVLDAENRYLDKDASEIVVKKV
ncbi:N-acetylmuramoyl-L-alanine amidase [Terrihalobacillus insolitus]|uniref:N-acetylmuramoyl-L-alanine amidase n=1 Tax=Terrihalobacillus insolitus TaxID=2950438 RepID=UPI00233FF0F6|nr:N-acetylmuramoyl-L-alanine amidase [Terrihalobacillus insolitus]MDC3414931.1 N-acetylmuramoyl-L-alanine amidase [Terrihalobacillus insolitus]